jgi:acyl carrier protein
LGTTHGDGEEIMDELKSQIKRMIVDEAPLMETYGVDSVALFELVVGLEDEFGVAMEDVEFDIGAFRDVNSIAEFVQEKRGA